MDINLSFVKNAYFLRSLKEYLEKLFQLDKNIQGVILFGSLATGEAIYSEREVSDIYLIVIFSDGELPKDHIERSRIKRELMDLALLGFDSIWITKTEFKKSVQIKSDIILSSLDKGKILFDPNDLIKNQKNKLIRELKEKGVKKRINSWIWPLRKLGDEIEW